MMHKINRQTFAFLLCAVLLFASLSGCGLTGAPAATPAPSAVPDTATPPAGTAAPDSTPEPPAATPAPTAEPLSIAILYEDGPVTEVSAEIGSVLLLDTEKSEGEWPALDAETAWSSSNENVAKVDGNGVVSAMAAGSTVITYTWDVGGSMEMKSECTVKVTEPEKPVVKIFYSYNNQQASDFTLNATANETCKLYATVTGQGAEDTVFWSTEDTKIATVTQEGVVEGISQGWTTVVCACGEGKATCIVRVNGKKATFNTPEDDATQTDNTDPHIAITYGGYVMSDFTLPANSTLQMSYKLYNTDEAGTAMWSTEDTKIATVDSNGIVTGLRAGSTTLKCTYNSLSYTCIVRVS